MHHLSALLTLCLLVANHNVWAEDKTTSATTAAPTSASEPKRDVQSLYDGQDSFDPIDEEPKATSGRHRLKTKSGIGVQISGYYDGLSTYDQTFANGFANPTGYTKQSFNGITGLQVMAGYAQKRWEFLTGVDYSLPLNIQGQNGSVISQDLEIMGLKAAQVGYRVAEGNLLIVPYGGVGLYYGKNVLRVTNIAENTITHVKFMATVIGGVRLDYNFTNDGTFIGGLGAEVFMPVKLADHLAQSGTFNSEFPGFGPQLQSHMDFMNSVGGRLMASVSAFF